MFIKTDGIHGDDILIDAVLFDKVQYTKWCIANTGYAIGSYKGSNVMIHHLITDRIGLKDGFVIDHINRNKLDNRLQNLRIVTQKENALNVERVNKSSGVQGMYYRKSENRWDIRVNGTHYKTTKCYKTGIEMVKMAELIEYGHYIDSINDDLVMDNLLVYYNASEAKAIIEKYSYKPRDKSNSNM